MKIKKYTITLEEDETYRMKRSCEGFNPIELLGILEFCQLEILQQMAGEITPDVVEREVIVP